MEIKINNPKIKQILLFISINYKVNKTKIIYFRKNFFYLFNVLIICEISSSLFFLKLTFFIFPL